MEPISVSEIARLRNIARAARDYFEHYCLDEADDVENCIDREQHEMAIALQQALSANV